ncbi:MAG: hypothetical protein U0790_01310 [Isosphaeraceae bacterium]
MSQPRGSDPFMLRHAMILVAATACGLALTRSLAPVLLINSVETVGFRTGARLGPEAGLWSEDMASNAVYYGEVDGRSLLAQPWQMVVAYVTQRLAFWPCPMLLSWSLALCVLALPRLRSGRRRFRPGPGAIAALASVLAFLALGTTFPRFLFWYAMAPGGWVMEHHWLSWWAMACFALPRAAGLAVAVSWLTLALCGRWRPDRGWLDRLGRLLGVCWIVLGVTQVVSSWMAVFVG